MAAVVAPLVAVFIHFASHDQFQHRRQPTYARAKLHIHSQTATNNRVARMTRLLLLARREAMLHDLLIAARTERPLFHDDKLHKVAPGIEISSSAVTLDFIGNPVIRARVKSTLPAAQTALIIADMTDAQGAHARAGAAVLLLPGETRIIELLCPQRMVPTSLWWSTMQL